MGNGAFVNLRHRPARAARRVAGHGKVAFQVLGPSFIRRRGTHRRTPRSSPMPRPSPPVPVARPAQGWPVPGAPVPTGPVATPPPEPGVPAPASAARYAPSRGPAGHQIPAPPTSPMPPAPRAVMPDPRISSGRVRPLVTGPAPPARGTGPGADGDAAWVPAGQLVQVSGCSIAGGLVYVGRKLTAARGGEPDPALIDPDLDVDHRAADYAGAYMGYWPSYTTIAPACRAAYLQWLANGRHAQTRTSAMSFCTSTAWNGACLLMRSGRRWPGPSARCSWRKSGGFSGSTGRTAHSAAMPRAFWLS